MEIRKYFSLLTRWWWLILLAMLISGVTAYIISINTPKVYQAKARILIELPPGDNSYSDFLVAQQQSATLATRMTTQEILTLTSQRLNISPIQLGSINVLSPEDLQILEVVTEHESPTMVANIANTLAEVFIEYEEKRVTSRFSSSMDEYEEQKENLRDQIELVQLEIATLKDPSSPTEEAQLSRLETLERELQLSFTRTVNDLESLRVIQLNGATLLDLYEPAIVPQSHIRPYVGRNTLLAIIVGAMLAIGVIFLLDYLDDTVKSPDEVREDTGLATLGVIAEIPGNSPDQMLITRHTPRSPTSEAFRGIRTNLGFSAIDRELTTMLVTSASPGEGKSTIASNLAVVMAQTGKKVLLIDADLRLPKQHKVFKVGNNQGLTTALLDSETPLSHHFHATRIRGLHLMTSGPLPPNPSELLNSKRMGEVIEMLKDEVDIVVFDTPPVLTVADAAILGAQVNGCVLVAEVGITNRSAVVRAVEMLQSTGGKVFGVTLNKLNLKRLGYYDYYYHYQYYAYAYDYNVKKPSNSKPPRLLKRFPRFGNR